MNCPRDRKRSYTSYRQAERAAHSLKHTARVYWCPAAGAYHLTASEKAEYDRERARRSAGGYTEMRETP